MIYNFKIFQIEKYFSIVFPIKDIEKEYSVI